MTADIELHNGYFYFQYLEYIVLIILLYFYLNFDCRTFDYIGVLLLALLLDIGNLLTGR